MSKVFSHWCPDFYKKKCHFLKIIFLHSRASHDASLPGIDVIIEGCIGAGKSTLLSALSQKAPWIAVKRESVGERVRDILAKFYSGHSDPEVMALLSFKLQVEILLAAAERDRDISGKVCVFERTLRSNRYEIGPNSWVPVLIFNLFAGFLCRL